MVRHDEKDNAPATKLPVGVAELGHESILELISLLKKEKERIHNKVTNKGDLLEFETDNLEKRRAWKKGGKGLTPRWYPQFRQTAEQGERREDNVESTTTTTKTKPTKKENKVVVDGNDDKTKKSMKKHNNMLMMMDKHSDDEWMNEDIRRRRNKKTSSSSDMVKVLTSLKRKRNFIGSAALPVSFYMAKYQFGKRDTV